MTQPIQEPSTPRSVSGLAWGEAQLARRPAPATAAPVFLPWGYRDSAGQGPQTVNGLAPIVFPDISVTSNWDVSDLADIEPVDDSDTYGDVFGLHLIRRGFWRVRINCNFFEADPSIPYAFVFLGPANGNQIVGYQGETYGGNTNKSFEMIINSDQIDNVYPFFFQNAGSDKQFNAPTLTAVFLGDFVGAATWIM